MTRSDRAKSCLYIHSRVRIALCYSRMQRRIVAYLDVETHCYSSTVYCGGVDYGNVALVASPQVRRQSRREARKRERVSMVWKSREGESQSRDSLGCYCLVSSAMCSMFGGAAPRQRQGSRSYFPLRQVRKTVDSRRNAQHYRLR